MKFSGRALFWCVLIAVGWGARAFTEHPAVRAGLEVYMGFMDEEVKFVLQKLIQENPDRPVVVLERARSSPAQLFELPMGIYGQEPVAEKLSSFSRQGKNFQARWAVALRAGLAKAAPELRAALDPATKAKTKVGEEPFQLLTFNGKGRGEPIVLVRSPEMGLQPSLVPRYIETIVDSLRRVREGRAENGGVQLSVLGTSGAIGSHLRPGELNRVNGSVFVGAEIVHLNGPSGEIRYRGVIRLVDNTGSKPQLFFQTELFTSRKEAEAAAKERFDRKDVGSLVSIEDSKKQEPTTLAEAVRLIKTGRGGSVSLTVSFFGGEPEKEAGRLLGLSNVNMEDYHVLVALREVLVNQTLGTVNVTRFNCDPPQISPEVVRAMEKWGVEKKYAADHYIDAIVWGLKGSMSDHPPGNAAWRALDGIKDADTYAYRMGNGEILDPFYAEIASDFLTAAQKGEAIGPELVSKVVYDRLTAKQQEALKTVLAKKSQELSRRAQEIFHFFGENFEKGGLPAEKEEVLRKMIGELVAETKYLEIPTDAPDDLYGGVREAVQSSERKRDLFKQGGRLRLLAAESGPQDLEIWVRSGKWKGNKTMNLEHLLHELAATELKGLTGVERARRFQEQFIGDAFAGLDGANADRALYKTGLVGGMLRASYEHVLRRSYFFRLRDRAFFDGELEKLKKRLLELKARNKIKC